MWRAAEIRDDFQHLTGGLKLSYNTFMNLKDLERLFSYNRWANNLAFDSVAQLTEEERKRDLKSSHHSIFGTLQHIAGAERVWLNRWTGNPTATLTPEELPDQLDGLRSQYDATRKEMEQYFATLDDAKLESGLTVKTSKGVEYTNTYEEMIQHLFNHSTFHRGQISGMLRQLGKTPPALDLIRFLRNR